MGELTLGDVTISMARSQAWDLLFWPVNALLAVSIGLSIATVWIGSWGRLSIALKLLVEMAAAIVAVYLLRVPEVVIVEGLHGDELEVVRFWLAATVRMTLFVILAIAIYEFVKYGWIGLRLLRAERAERADQA